MSFSLSQASLPAFAMGLNALSGVLDKAQAYAEAKKIDPSVLLSMRLAPDMFTFTRQVQIACDQAKNGAGRMAGGEVPKFDDNETTIQQLKERVAKTLSYVQSLDTKAIDASGDKTITFPMGPTAKGNMQGEAYLNHFVLPNFYFHMAAAYGILRHAGAPVGKNDFLGAIPLTKS